MEYKVGMKFNYDNGEIGKIIQIFSKAVPDEYGFTGTLAIQNTPPYGDEIIHYRVHEIDDLLKHGHWKICESTNIQIILNNYETESRSNLA